jgi:hypothetical protein
MELARQIFPRDLFLGCMYDMKSVYLQNRLSTSSVVSHDIVQVSCRTQSTTCSNRTTDGINDMICKLRNDDITIEYCLARENLSIVFL